MRTDSVKKYVIPNIPYLFILWACLKLGTAYRLAPGADFAHKLMGLGQSIGPAFADFAPGLAPFDWLIGIVGAVGFRLLIYFKSKNAKKFRRDEEYGSARWGTEKDIKPFVDPKFENNVILTKTEFLTMNKLAFNLTKRQLVCFGIAAAVGIPSYLLARSSIGNTGAMFLMMAVALPAFLLAMYEKDGLPFEKVVRNILRARFLRPGVRPYQTENIYAPFTQRGAVRKEDAIAKSKQPKARPRKGR